MVPERQCLPGLPSGWTVPRPLPEAQVKRVTTSDFFAVKEAGRQSSQIPPLLH